MTVPSLLILGTDAVLAAVPATPVQLVHACMAAGYHAVIPASWGDELVAARAAERLRDGDGGRVLCCCPHVSQRLEPHGDAIAPMMLAFVAPPVATAMYLRAAYKPSRPHITFAGGCPAGSHASVDVWLSVAELLMALRERGIVVAQQPTEFDSVLPPDRRRFFSEPGGVPSRASLRRLPAAVELVELMADDVVVDLAQHLLSASRSLVDIAVPLGCYCSGAGANVSRESARALVREHEPPRALSPVVDHSMSLALDAEPAMFTRFAMPAGALPRVAEPALTPDGGAQPVTAPAPVAVESRRRPSPGITRPVLGTMPQTRTDAGRHLPRAYVARRRSSPRGLRESAISRAEAPTAPRSIPRSRWIIVGGIGVAMGLALAWLLRFLP